MILEKTATTKMPQNKIKIPLVWYKETNKKGNL